MLHMNRKNKIIISIVGISIISLALIGLTYGYYLTRIQGNTNNKSISISTANLELTYSDNSDVITGTNIVPGTTLGTKTFTVTNNGDNNVDSYSVGLVNVINTFTRLDDIKYKVTCSSSVKDKKCNGVSESTFPNENSYIIENQINKDEVQTYVIEVEYKEMNVDQSVDMGKTLEAKIDIFDTKALTIKGTVTNSRENDYVVIHSKEQTSEIVDGKYKFIGIEPDTHKITIKNRKTTSTKQTTLNVSKGEPSASGSNITYNDEKNIADADIKITGDTVMIDATKISVDKILLKDAIIENAKNGSNGTIYSETPLTKPAEEVSSYKYYTDQVDEEVTEPSSISTTHQGYYWTYGTGYTIDESTGKFTLTGVATCKYNDGTCNKTLIGKYLVDYSAYRNSSSTNTKKTTTNLGRIYKVIEAPASSTNDVIMKIKKLKSIVYGTEATLSSSTDDYGKSYYFRGDINDNYINFAGMCWRIVRIVGDGSIKLILEDQNTMCENSQYTGNWRIEESYFGYAININDLNLVSNKNVNYSISLLAADIHDSYFYANYLNSSGNLSLAKAFYNFQKNKLSSYLNKLKIGDWCLSDIAYNDDVGTTKLSKSDKYNNYSNGINFYYDTYVRLNGKTPKEPTLKCIGTNMSKFSDDTDMYVGTLTADEVLFAGESPAVYLVNIRNYYGDFFTLSLAYFDLNKYGDIAYELTSSGNVRENIVVGGNGSVVYSRPSINLKSGISIVKGDGTQSNPYVVE